ncbi:hypothetical protein ACOSQ3_011146 [Xanthoceras sorbifolium]
MSSFFWSCAGGCDWRFIVNESVDCSSLKCGQDLSQQLALVLSLNKIFLVSERYCNTMVEGSKFLILQKLLGNVLFNNIPCPLPDKSMGCFVIYYRTGKRACFIARVARILIPFLKTGVSEVLFCLTSVQGKVMLVTSV